ncbi:MAG: hypothetical protein J6B93_03330 [Clostridia bacterium]|nr:hypothetical protein [Clostridia bacterium]
MLDLVLLDQAVKFSLKCTSLKESVPNTWVLGAVVTAVSEPAAEAKRVSGRADRRSAETSASAMSFLPFENDSFILFASIIILFAG